MIQPKNKTILIKGLKGDTGDAGTDSTIPLSGLIAINDEIEIPAGYAFYEYVEDGTLIGITATYNQTATITEQSSLEDLRPDLTVLSTYDNGHTYIVTDYTLSGTLTVGTSTITANYKGFSDTFDVTVEEGFLFEWDFTESLTDKIKGYTATLTGAEFVAGTGLIFDSYADSAYLGADLLKVGRALEIDFTTFNAGDAAHHKWLVQSDDGGGGLSGFAYRRYSSTWRHWQALYGSANWLSYSTPRLDAQHLFMNSTGKFIFNSDSDIEIYVNDVLKYKGDSFIKGSTAHEMYLGDKNPSTAHGILSMVITRLRIYNNA